jgi:hypothetical protein
MLACGTPVQRVSENQDEGVRQKEKGGICNTGRRERGMKKI